MTPPAACCCPFVPRCLHCWHHCLGKTHKVQTPSACMFLVTGCRDGQQSMSSLPLPDALLHQQCDEACGTCMLLHRLHAQQAGKSAFLLHTKVALPAATSLAILCVCDHGMVHKHQHVLAAAHMLEHRQHEHCTTPSHLIEHIWHKAQHLEACQQASKQQCEVLKWHEDELGTVHLHKAHMHLASCVCQAKVSHVTADLQCSWPQA